MPARPAVWPPSSRHRACVQPRQAGRFYQDRQQFSSAEATSPRLPPSLLVNSPEGKASGRGTAGASRLADAGSSCACHSDRRSRLRARRGACARCPVRSRQRSRHLPSPRLSAASLGHFEDGTSPGRAGTPRSPFPVVARCWDRTAGTGFSTGGRGLAVLVTSRGVSFSCLSLWLRCRVSVARSGAVVRGPATDGPAKRPLSLHNPEASWPPPSPAENCQSFRAPFTSVSVRSSGVVSDFPGRGA